MMVPTAVEPMACVGVNVGAIVGDWVTPIGGSVATA
jgi:hypothetical protein